MSLPHAIIGKIGLEHEIQVVKVSKPIRDMQGKISYWIALSLSIISIENGSLFPFNN
jgi:hypothetical protein